MSRSLILVQRRARTARRRGMTDAVLDRLVHLRPRRHHRRLSLVPLIQVAWADGEIQDNERTGDPARRWQGLGSRAALVTRPTGLAREGRRRASSSKRGRRRYIKSLAAAERRAAEPVCSRTGRSALVKMVAAASAGIPGIGSRSQHRGGKSSSGIEAAFTRWAMKLLGKTGVKSLARRPRRGDGPGGQLPTS